MRSQTKTVHAVGVLYEEELGNVLILRRHPASAEGGRWGLPGGGIESGEQARDAAIREVREEICHEQNPGELTPLRRYRWAWNEQDIYFEVFKAQVRREDLVIDLNRDESTEFLWAEPVQLVGRGDLIRGLYPILRDEYGDPK